MDQIIGQILYVPWGWTMQYCLPCSGQLLQVQQYAALYSLLGNYFGGDGQHTFALPDLRSVDANGHRVEWPQHGAVVPHMVINGIYPSRD